MKSYTAQRAQILSTSRFEDSGAKLHDPYGAGGLGARVLKDAGCGSGPKMHVGAMAVLEPESLSTE